MPNQAEEAKKKSKSKSKPVQSRDETSRKSLSPMKTVDSTSSIPASESTALSLKRRHVYDSLEHCRANQSKQISTSKSTSPNGSQNDPSAELSANTLNFIESLQSKSTSRSSSRYHDTSMEGKPANLKITSWNINGLRSWLSKRAGLTFIAQDDADIYCFQETKCDSANIPNEIKEVPGYKCFWNNSTDRHSGVVCFAKREPINVTYGIGSSIFDKEGRVITLEYNDYFLVNAFVPNSGPKLVKLEHRLKWDTSFYTYLKKLETKKAIIVCGDLNVSHREIDLANPKANSKTAGYTQAERDNFTKLLEDLSLVDVFRYLNPVKRDCYTYWTFMRNARQRNIGWRLDYFLMSRRWLEKVCDCIIRSDVHGSDHCPISMFISV